jgi:hypothetical protein
MPKARSTTSAPPLRRLASKDPTNLSSLLGGGLTAILDFGDTQPFLDQRRNRRRTVSGSQVMRY